MHLHPLTGCLLSTFGVVHMLRSLRLAPLRSITRFQPILQTVRTMSDIKTLEVDASELKDGQMKSIDFHGGKVLLSKVNGEIVRFQGCMWG